MAQLKGKTRSKSRRIASKQSEQSTTESPLPNEPAPSKRPARKSKRKREIQTPSSSDVRNNEAATNRRGQRTKMEPVKPKATKSTRNTTKKTSAVGQEAPVAPMTSVSEAVPKCMDCTATPTLDEIVLCDRCDGEFHISCIQPPLLNGIPEGEWVCSMCPPAAQSVESVSRKSKRLKKSAHGSYNEKGRIIYDEAQIEGNRLAKVLICSVCAKEYDVNHILKTLEGPVICESCQNKKRRTKDWEDKKKQKVKVKAGAEMNKKVIHQQGTTAFVNEVEHGAILLCDGCDGEFDMLKLAVPLTKIPEGDWFCPNCTEQAREEEKESLCSEEQLLIMKQTQKEDLILLHELVGNRVLVKSVFVVPENYEIRRSEHKHWYSGRLMEFDPRSHSHRVRFVDDQERWVDLSQVECFVGRQSVWAKSKQHACWWPAQIFLPFASMLKNVQRATKTVPEELDDHITGPPDSYLVKFFQLPGTSWVKKHIVREYRAFDFQYDQPVDKTSLQSFEHRRRIFLKAIRDVENEYRMVEAVRDDARSKLLLFQQTRTYGKDWVGRHVQVYVNLESNAEKTCRRGKIIKYNSSNKNHLVLLDKDKQRNDLTQKTSSKENESNTENNVEIPENNADSSPTPQLWIDLTIVPLTLVTDEDYFNLSVRLLGDPVDENLHYIPSSTPAVEPIVCSWCALEGEEGSILTCCRCSKWYHGHCADPPMESVVDDYICQMCMECQSCNRGIDAELSNTALPNSIQRRNGGRIGIPKKQFQWHIYHVGVDQVKVCSSCVREFEQCQYCPICLKTWSNSEETLDSDQMIPCEACDAWTHAKCENISNTEFEEILNGTHALWGEQYTCRACRVVAMVRCLDKLCEEDRMFVFSEPVTIDIAPTYFEVIKEPMDLRCMREKTINKVYSDAQMLRDDFELLCLNAVIFNSRETRIWKEAWRFYRRGIEILEQLFPRTVPGQYSKKLDITEQKQIPKKRSAENVEVDEYVSELPPLGAKPKPYTCLPSAVIYLSKHQASICAWIDLCLICASGGIESNMIFCVDCGEGFHSFCLNPPLKMTPRIKEYWRCNNCKICEICSKCTADDEHNLLVCEECDRGYHTFCLRPRIKHIPTGKWFCGSCVSCNTCGTKISRNNWSTNISMCRLCQEKEKARRNQDRLEKTRFSGISAEENHCPICMQERSPDEEFLKCDHCSSSVHPKCDDIDNGQYVEFSKNKSISYYCPCCRRAEDSTTAIGTSNEAWSIQLLVNDIQQQRRDISNEWKSQRRNQQQDHQYSHLEQYRSIYEAVIAEGSRTLTQLALHSPQKNLISSANSKAAKELPYWIVTRASRYVRRRIYCRGPRIEVRERQVAQSPKHVSKLISDAMSAASFLAVCHVQYGYPGLSRFTASLLMPPGSVFGNQLDVLNLLPPTSKTEPPVATPFSTAEKWIDPASKSWEEELNCAEKEADLKKKTSTSEQESKGTPTEINADKTDRGTAGVKQEPLVHTTGNVNQMEKKESADLPKQAKADMTCASPMRGWAAELDGQLGKFDDLRSCGYCRLTGDTRINGRLLNVDYNQWAHVNCALWSTEVYENSSGHLMRWHKARKRGRINKCSLCGMSGATISCCSPKCSVTYHLDCAIKDGSKFYSNKQVFCKETDHLPLTDELQAAERIDWDKVNEPLRLILPEQAPLDLAGRKYSLYRYDRIGSLTVHNLGSIAVGHPKFFSPEAIFPVGFRSSRIHWSTKYIRRRCLYECEILYSSEVMDSRVAPSEQPQQAPNSTQEPCFRITPSDNLEEPILASSANDAVAKLRQRLLELYQTQDIFEEGAHPFLNRSSWNSYGLVGGHFFGYQLPAIAKAIEELPHAAVAAIEPKKSKRYRFCYILPSKKDVEDAHMYLSNVLMARTMACNSSGCARTDGWRPHAGKLVAMRSVSRKQNRALVKGTEDDKSEGKPGAPGSRMVGDLPLPMQYRELRRRPFEERLEVHKSRIHGWGLFVKEKIGADKMIVEYQGQAIRQKVADEREKRYEEQGIGSCYMFRLDTDTIIDATFTGNLARFINHCCDPNAYAKIVSVDGNEKKIIIFAIRDLMPGEEVTYDYKFPIEDEALRCDCGAVNCIGRMN